MGQLDPHRQKHVDQVTGTGLFTPFEGSTLLILLPGSFRGPATECSILLPWGGGMGRLGREIGEPIYGWER